MRVGLSSLHCESYRRGEAMTLLRLRQPHYMGG